MAVDHRPHAARLALIGGEEFSDTFQEVHAELLAGLTGRRIAFLPTCAADDGVEAVDYWCRVAREKLGALGAVVTTPRILDIASANEDSHASQIAEADWVYLGGGYPHVAMRILPGTRAMQALSAALARGALVSGSSGGAMLMCGQSFVVTPELAAEISRYWETGVPNDWNPPFAPLDCLGWLPGTVCVPHFNRRLLPKQWLAGEGLPGGFTLIGVDEQTALVSRGDQRWEVRGRGAVTIIRNESQPVTCRAGEQVRL